jgi:hypothetical protein
MITHAPIALPATPEWRHRQVFDYRRPPRAGMNWPFAQAMILDLALWSSVAVGVTFWACLLVAVLN